MRKMRKHLTLTALALTFSIMIGTALVAANINNVIEVNVYIWPQYLIVDGYNRCCPNHYGFNEWVTAFIQLPREYTTQDVDLTSITLHVNGGSLPTSKYYTLWGRIIIAKFDRTEVINLIKASIEHMTPYPVQKATLVVTGNLHDGNTFKGEDTITVLFTNN